MARRERHIIIAHELTRRLGAFPSMEPALATFRDRLQLINECRKALCFQVTPANSESHISCLDILAKDTIASFGW